MKHAFNRKPLLFCFLYLLIIYALISWRKEGDSTHQQQFRDRNQQSADTSKPGKHSPAKDGDLAELDKAMAELDLQMKELDKEMAKIDFVKVQKEIQNALKEINFNKMQLDIEDAMKKVDMQKIQQEVERAIKLADKEIKQANSVHLKKQMEQLQEQLSSVQANLKVTLSKAMQESKEAMAKAKIEMTNAKEEMKNTKAFIDALEKNGLIDRKKGYKIKVDDGQLYINGNKQSQDIFEKYKQYYRKSKFTINSDGDEIISL